MTNPAIDRSIPTGAQTQHWQKRDLILITIVLFLVSALDFFTPPEYILGFLYLCPLLLANRRLTQQFVLLITGVIAFLMLLNLWFPQGTLMTLPAIVNRLVATLALMITTVLSLRNTNYARLISNQQAEFAAQSQLTSLREDFASTLTHDLKTPLLGAITTLNALLEGQFGSISQLQTQVLSTMERSHKTSVQLLETLLDVYRNDATGLVLHLETIDLTKLVEETANQVAGLAHHRQVQIAVWYGDSEFRRSLRMQADALQLQRVLMNLLVNAINHSSRGDRVEVRLSSSGSHHSVQVCDQGAGLKPEVITQLFQRFYQGNNDRQAKGTGLGLYLARQIITAHHGTIWAEPLSPKGAVFIFQLPVYQP
jgi:two-component system, NarL family, sensor kinase